MPSAFSFNSSVNVIPAGYVQMTAANLASAVALTAPSADSNISPNCAILQAEGDSIRYRDDGGTPTASVGMVIAAGQSLSYTGNLSLLKVIRVSASSILNIAYYDVSRVD